MFMASSLPVAKDGLVPVFGGTSAPAAAMDTYAMTSFGDDTRPTFSEYDFVTSPLGGNINFGKLLEHCKIQEEWLTWSHGYMGDVYRSGKEEYTITLILPAGTSAFYFYAQPYNTAEYSITAVAYDGVSHLNNSSISHSVSGSSGASYFGFYGTDNSVIATITIICETKDFAVGEFGISMIPAPGAIILACIGVCMTGWLKKRRKFL